MGSIAQPNSPPTHDDDDKPRTSSFRIFHPVINILRCGRHDRVHILEIGPSLGPGVVYSEAQIRAGGHS